MPGAQKGRVGCGKFHKNLACLSNVYLDMGVERLAITPEVVRRGYCFYTQVR